MRKVRTESHDGTNESIAIFNPVIYVQLRPGGTHTVIIEGSVCHNGWQKE